MLVVVAAAAVFIVVVMLVANLAVGDVAVVVGIADSCNCCWYSTKQSIIIKKYQNLLISHVREYRSACMHPTRFTMLKVMYSYTLFAYF